MYVSISEIDLVTVLGLDRSLSPGEIDQLLDSLSEEIFFRLLTEKLPKLLSKKDFQYLHDKYLMSDDLDALMKEIQEKWPGINIDIHFKQTASEVKREYMINYLSELKEDYKDRNVQISAELLIKELQKDQVNLDRCLSLKEEIIKSLIKINR